MKVDAAWLKEKALESLVQLVVAGIIVLIGWSVSVAYIGDSKIEKVKDAFKTEMVNNHNETVAREAEFLKKLNELEEKINELKKIPQTPVTSIIPNIPLAPSNSFQPNFQPAESKTEQKDNRLDYIKKNSQRVESKL